MLKPFRFLLILPLLLSVAIKPSFSAEKPLVDWDGYKKNSKNQGQSNQQEQKSSRDTRDLERFIASFFASSAQYYLAHNVFGLNQAIYGENTQLQLSQEGKIQLYAQGILRHFWNTLWEKPLSVIFRAYHTISDTRGAGLSLMHQWSYLKGKLSCPSDHASHLNFLESQIADTSAQRLQIFRKLKSQSGRNPDISKLNYFGDYILFLQSQADNLRASLGA